MSDGGGEASNVRTVAHGGMWSLGAGMVTLAASLIATPFMVRGLGDEAYGVYAIIQVVVGYFGLIDFGMGDASTRFSGDAHARGDRAGEVAVLWSALAVQALPSLLALALFAGGAAFITDDLLRLPPSVREAALVALPLSGIALVLRNAAHVFNSPQAVRLRYRNLALIGVVCGLTQLSSIAIIASHGGGLVWCVVALVLSNTLQLLLQLGYASILLPEVRRPRFDRAVAWQLARYGAWMMVVTFVTTVIMQSEKVLITRFASPTALAYYAVAFSLGQVLTMLPRALGGALFPVFSRLQAEPSRASMTALYGQLTRSALYLSAPVAVVMCVAAAPFFAVWAGPAYGVHSPEPFYVLVVGFLAAGIAQMPLVLLKGIARVDLVARFNLILVLPFLAIAVPLAGEYGALGGAIAFTARSLADSALHFAAVRRLVDARVWAGGKQFAAFVVAAAVLAIPVATLAVPGLGHPLRAAITAAALLAYVVLLWRTVLADDERRALRSLISRGWARRRPPA